MNLDESDDPFADHYRREPLPNAGVRVVAISGVNPARSREIAEGIAAAAVRIENLATHLEQAAR